METNNIFAFIFARGGSKGIPFKNIVNLNGKPLIQYSIEIAKQMDQIQKIFVSTDCEKIKAVSLENDVEVIDRPPDLATDQSPEWLSWQHAIRTTKEKYGNFKYFLSLPATSPLRNKSDIEKCIYALNKNVDLVLTMTEAKRNPWFNMVKFSENGNLKLIINDKFISRRQDAPICYDLTTVAYFARPSFILKSKGIWDGKVAGVEIPNERAIDIDNLFDLEIASFFTKKNMPNSY